MMMYFCLVVCFVFSELEMRDSKMARQLQMRNSPVVPRPVIDEQEQLSRQYALQLQREEHLRNYYAQAASPFALVNDRPPPVERPPVNATPQQLQQQARILDYYNQKRDQKLTKPEEKSEVTKFIKDKKGKLAKMFSKNSKNSKFLASILGCLVCCQVFMIFVL
jgi:hypothetical protein